jgi:hypothetical protein
MKSKRSGSLSMYGLLVMAVVLVGSLGISSYAVSGMKRARREQNTVQAFEAAQAGLEQAITTAYNQLSASNGDFVQSSFNYSSTMVSIAPGCTVLARVDPTADATSAWVTSTCSVNGFQKSVRTLINERNVGIWNNAIFAGTGASGHAINGNVDVRGSVHILGEGEPFTDLNGDAIRNEAEVFTDVNANGVRDPGEPFTDKNGDGLYTLAEPYNDSNQNGFYDPPMTQTDLDSSFGGTAYLGNNYSGMPAGLEALVPTAPRIGGIETLSAEVRCKHGRIGISGTAAVGSDAIIDGGTSKGTVDGTYVTDGWAGNQGSNHVYSDNGSANPYDVGGLGISFPYIGGIGAQPYVASDNTVWNTHEDYLNQRSILCPITTITATTAAFSYGPDAYGNKISFTPATASAKATLEVTGVVRFASDLQIGSKDQIYYKGNGTLYAPNVRIDGDFLPLPGFTFPTTSRMGVIAKQNMYLATGAGSSQLSMAGAFFAQGKIVSQKQNQIAGTFVANFYDLGINVPNIYQVPALPKNMPPAMPGDKGYYALKIKSWRERSPAQIGQ